MIDKGGISKMVLPFFHRRRRPPNAYATDKISNPPLVKFPFLSYNSVNVFVRNSPEIAHGNGLPQVIFEQFLKCPEKSDGKGWKNHEGTE